MQSITMLKPTCRFSELNDAIILQFWGVEVGVEVGGEEQGCI